MTADEDSFTAENEEDKEAWAAMRAIHAAGPQLSGPGFTEDPVTGRVVRNSKNAHNDGTFWDGIPVPPAPPKEKEDWEKAVDQKTAEHKEAWAKAQQEHTRKITQEERDAFAARQAMSQTELQALQEAQALEQIKIMKEVFPNSTSEVSDRALATRELPVVAESKTVLGNVFNAEVSRHLEDRDRPIQTAFKNEYLSVSRLQAYEQCPRSFYFKYVDKTYAKIVDSEMGAGTFGSFLHEAHESIVKWVVSEEFSGVVPGDVIRDHARSAWEKTEGAKGIDLYAEGVGYIRKYFSHAIDCWDVVDVEREFRIQVGEFTILGYMDLVKKTRLEAGQGVKIVDYKSNRAMYSKGDLDTNMQLAVYTIAAKELYPWAKSVEAEMHMLRYGGKPQVANITPEVLEHTKDYLIAMGRKTESDKEWKPILNANCGYCEHKQHCELFDQATRLGMPQTKSSADDLLSVSAEREQVAKVANAAYARKKKLDEQLKRALEETPELNLGEHRYYLSHPSGGTEYDPAAFFKLLKHHGVPKERMQAMVKVEHRSVEEFLKTFRSAQAAGETWANAILQVEIEALAVKLDGSPRLEMRKIK